MGYVAGEMRRRDFLFVVIGGSPIVWPRLTLAQQSTKLPIIGFLGVNSAMWAPWTAGFVDRLTALGWVDGKTAKLEFRWAQGRPELHTQLAEEFVRMGA